MSTAENGIDALVTEAATEAEAPEDPTSGQVATNSKKRFKGDEKIEAIERVLQVDQRELGACSAELDTSPENITAWIELYNRGGRRELKLGGPDLDTETKEAISHLEALIRKRILEGLQP